MHLRRSPGRLSLLGMLGMVIFTAAIIAATLHEEPRGAGFAAFMVAACYLWARVPPRS